MATAVVIDDTLTIPGWQESWAGADFAPIGSHPRKAPTKAERELG
jgi:hypothetical protein